MAEVLRLNELTSPRLAEVLAWRPVGLWPVGAVEPHGPHAPLGTDTLIAAGVCERAAARLGDPPCVVLPALPFGVTRYAASFAGALGVTEATLAGVVRDVAAAADAQGFRKIVVVNCHFEPEQVQTLRAVCAEAGVLYLDLVRRRAAERLTEEFRRGSCHAGRYETSLVLADAPELVDRARMRELPAVPVDMPAAMASGLNDFPSMGMTEAYCGAPAEATAQEGVVTFETLTDMLVELILQQA
ncbi:MAG TPA: creatininase family protein [Solirubrobacteraceae bacterium]|jgi:creatinine amidohydrolase|nr:creatininase family protein [Solirubrobacteraceae bacterium]